MKTLYLIFISIYIVLAIAFVLGIFIKKRSANKTIYFGFHIIYFALALGFVWNFVKIIDIQHFPEHFLPDINGKNFKEIGDSIKGQPTIDYPKRGTIYCYDKNGEKIILSEDLPVYKIGFNGEQVKRIEKAIRDGEIVMRKKTVKDGEVVMIKKKFSKDDNMNDYFNASDSIKKLADLLAKEFGGKAAGYNDLMKAYNNENRNAKILDTVIDIIKLNKISQFVLFNGGNGRYGSCLVQTEKANRIMPYEGLAKRTIGDIYKDKKDGFNKGIYGIEAQFDSILKGVAGEKQNLKISLGRTVIKTNPKKPKQKGADIVLTLDMDMQEIVANCLIQQAQKLSAERACAILMEVETGEIKAMVNLIQGKNGYFEGANMAISNMNPPGSTFKTLSMLVALENGFTADTIVNSFDKKYPKVTDHAPNVSWRAIPFSDVLVFSSNVGISNAIGGKFGKNPMNFIKEIHKTKINEEFDIMLPGAAKFQIGPIKYEKGKIIYGKDTTNSSDLPSLSFGYQVVIPPIYMLRFYNAIANNGKLINPFIVKDICRNGKSVKEINVNGKTVDFPAKTQVVNPSICSTQTLKQLQKMLYEVVRKKGGTGYEHKSEKVEFAGKTGTAVFKVNGETTDQVSFCGYFPADSIGIVKPKYSCIVVMQRKGLWGSQSCEVFKKIAEKIYALEPITIKNKE